MLIVQKFTRNGLVEVPKRKKTVRVATGSGLSGGLEAKLIDRCKDKPLVARMPRWL